MSYSSKHFAQLQICVKLSFGGNSNSVTSIQSDMSVYLCVCIYIYIYTYIYVYVYVYASVV